MLRPQTGFWQFCVVGMQTRDRTYPWLNKENTDVKYYPVEPLACYTFASVVLKNVDAAITLWIYDILKNTVNKKGGPEL